MSIEPEDTPLYLEYGDIIKIYAPDNKEIHQQTFFIKYIDSIKISLINTSTVYPYILYFKENEGGKLRDESIDEIHIIWKSPQKGYILQNGLEPNKWIDIYFGGDFPTVFTGKITDIQDDQMEVTIYPSLEVIYIDFEYKGLPEDKHIEKIILREKPNYVNGEEDKGARGSIGEEEETTAEESAELPSMEYTEMNESILKIPETYTVDPAIRKTLHKLYLDANDVIFETGEIEYVNQIVELDPRKKIYGLEEQTTNLLDEMLSTIPNNARSKSVMENIQRIINNFKHLRTEFSKIDPNGNIESPLILGPKHKPLVKKIKSLSSNLKWIIPVVTTNKTLYSVDTDDSASREGEGGEGGAEKGMDDKSYTVHFEENIQQIQETQDNYFKNTNGEGAVAKYPHLIKTTEKYTIPFTTIEPTPPNTLITTQVGAELESIIDNLEEFKTIVYKKSAIQSQKYVIQKYNLGCSMNWAEGKKRVANLQLTPNETIQIKSLMMMPEQLVRFSKIDQPTTNILCRSRYGQNYPMMHRIFTRNLENKMERVYIGKKTREYNYEKNEKDTNVPFLSNFKNFCPDAEEEQEMEDAEETAKRQPKTFENFLQKIVPSTYDLVSLIQKYIPLNEINGYSFVEMVKLLEPFAIYPKNISYNVYVRIRYFIKQAMTEWKNQQSIKGVEYRKIREKTWNIEDTLLPPGIISIFKEKTEFQTDFFKTYFGRWVRGGDGGNGGNGGEGANQEVRILKKSGITSSEALQLILSLDCGKSMTAQLHLMLLYLTIPDNLLAGVTGVTGVEDMTIDELEKIKPDNCSRRFLTKIYKSLKDLQTDNHAEIYYDKEFDQTPYSLLTKDVKAKKDKMTVTDFEEYFAEILVQKSAVPRAISHEMATAIIRGKKPVMEGEYAVLETYPEVIGEEDANIESLISKTYYIRTKNVWKKDDSIDTMDAFMDNNTLLCNLTKETSCVKRSNNSVCEETANARKEQLLKTRASLFKEFDTRFEESTQTLKETLEKEIGAGIRQCKKMERMTYIKLHKDDKYAHDIGIIAKNSVTEELNPSPFESLLDKILAQTDFVKAQKDILMFADRFTREPMVEALGDSPYWFYCRETNTRLLPIYIVELAKAYVSGGSDEYAVKLKEIVRKYGTISEDGDAIVDGLGGSGRVIQKIDFVEEEEYDDLGFKITTKTKAEKDTEELVREAIATTPAPPKRPTQAKKERIFENETVEVAYNILSTICQNIGIEQEGIEDDILRISSETANILIVSEKKYTEKMKGNEKAKPYVQYRNQNIILIVAFVTLVAIQTATPSFRPSNSVPGCVLSFEGFPLDGGEESNTDGLRYIACVLNISKSSIGAWASIKGIKDPVATFMKTMKEVVAKHVLPRADVMALFAKKREYRLLNRGDAELSNIPKKLSIQKWTTFLPPIVEYKINHTLGGKPLPANFFQDLRKSLIKGDKMQWAEIGTIKSKIIQYTFGIIEYINATVKRSDPVLNTASLLPFLQNACCNDRGATKTQSALAYFAQKEPEIIKYIEITRKIAESLELDEALSLASIFVHTLDTTRKSTAIPTVGHSAENIYQSFIHYGKFDNDAPIPEYLKALVTSKPPVDYNPHWTIAEKTLFLKENGKNYGAEDLDRLMMRVNSRNLVEDKRTASAPIRPEIPNTAGLEEYIAHLEYIDNSIIEEPLKKHLRAVLSKYKANTVALSGNEETNSLKNYLIFSNREMSKTVFQFMEEYRGSIDRNKIETAKLFIRDFTVWDGEQMATMVQFTKNAIREMSVIFPAMIQSNKPILKTVPAHWDLSVFHRGDVEKFVESYYIPLMKFMGDNSLGELLGQTTESLKHLIGFIEFIPAIPALRKQLPDEKTEGGMKEYLFYSVFDEETIYLLFGYLFQSVLYEYVQKSADPTMAKINGLNIRNEKRANNEEREDMANDIRGVEDAPNADYRMETDRMNEIQIRVGNLENIKKRTVELLVAFLSIEEDTKKSINKSYKTVSERVVRSKLDEKKTITDYFKNMTNDERKVENTLKILKMGRWNVGMQKGVFQYDKEVYDKEHANIINILDNGAGNGADNDYVIQPEEMVRGVEELEREIQKDADEEYGREEMGFQQLEEDYMDGNYYGNEGEDDFGND